MDRQGIIKVLVPYVNQQHERGKMIIRIVAELEISDEDVVPSIMTAFDTILPFMGDNVQTSVREVAFPSQQKVDSSFGRR